VADFTFSIAFKAALLLISILSSAMMMDFITPKLKAVRV
jgi:hypothetical protein